MSEEIKLLPEENELVENKNESEVPEKKKRNRKTDLYIELVLFFILGLLIGVTLKTEADKRITIGYNDYQMNIKKQDYNINQLQIDIAKKVAEENSSQKNNQAGNNQDQIVPQNQNPAPESNVAPDQNNQNQ
jgi:hypothetical protein